MNKRNNTIMLTLLGWLLLGLPAVPAAATAGLHTRSVLQATGLTTREICTNTCSKAKNGVCEEGRPGKVSAISPFIMAYCDLGTDCDDCGPWKTTSTNISWIDGKKVGPIRLLQSRDVQVRVKSAAVPQEIGFNFAYTDPKQDFDVSYHMENAGMVEAGITAISYKLMNGRCVKAGGNRELFVDVGANFGWFAILAAKLGCRVIAYEPVPLFRAFFEFSVHLNDLASLIDIRETVVSHESDTLMKMVVPARGIWGTAGIDGLNIDRAIQSDQEAIEVRSVRLEDEVKDDVLLLKIDVEGWEWSVVKGAEKFLGKHHVENIIMEYSPGVPERHFKWDHMAATPAMLVDLITKFKYRIGHIGDAGKHQSSGWDSNLVPLKEITMDNLKYDVEDIKLWQAGTMACPIPDELKQFEMWALCGGVPEGLNPRSLRAEIGHNTNIWASKGDGLKYLTLRDVVGILSPSDPKDKYFQNNEMNFGMGSRPCHFLDPRVLVKHRCNCTRPDVCGKEEEAAGKAAAEGRIPQNYVLP
ncbi:hypothetical protein Vretimale_17060 [Volvox reticuliferus]|uniref:Methyltransferase FkbM domain-containing protein n=2 Tax=Volvox reticuliferus TaxID=1737510 RepID=A0A8J4CW11_9CHLO|nr:hypothetical protein Vretifemale_18625 [Volvox reticuliferus]GIM14087.1 hypothetical protein Vretimale_17060 [Volvox reticuliferus]